LQEARRQVHCSNQQSRAFPEFSKADPEPAVKGKNEQSRITGILPEAKPGNESGELAVCNETRHEQIQKQRKRTKKISAAAADFFIAGEQAEFPHSTQAKE